MRVFAALLGALLLVGCTTVGAPPRRGDPKSDATVHTRLALNYLQRGQKRVALEEIEKALSIAPNLSGANYVMAMLQTQLGRPEKAGRYYQRALTSDPHNAAAAHDYGKFLCKQGKVEQAIENFQLALDNPLYRRKTLTNLRAGECLITMRTDRHGAEPYFRAALKVDPKLPAALYYMADISYATEAYREARAYIERYFSVAPDSAASLLLAVKIESKLNAHDATQAYASRLRKEFGGSAQAKQLIIFE